MYIVGGYLGYQWADFHCGFEMTFLCEYHVNEVEAWRRRRQMVNPQLVLNETTKDLPTLSTSPLSVRYGFLNRVPKVTTEPKSKVVVTQKPYRNSVVISTTKVETNEIEVDTNSNVKHKDEDSTVYNFLKNIIKFG